MVLSHCRGAIVAALCCLATNAIAAPLPRCAAIDPNALPDTASCQRRFSAIEPPALYEQADTLMKAGHFDDAAEALACASARIADGSDAHARYEWIRRRGVLSYRKEDLKAAHTHFDCALKVAESLRDRPAIAKQLRNKGSVLRRLGEYKDALGALEASLKIMREDGDAATGAVLNNIGDVYREIEEPTSAEQYYRDAMDAYRRQGDVVETNHVLDSLSLLALERGDTKTATRQLNTALEAYRRADNWEYQLRVYTLLIRAALIDGDVELARRYSADGTALVETHELPVHDEFYLYSARADRISGRVQSAEVKLRIPLERKPENDANHAELLLELAKTLEQGGRYAEALASMREARGFDLRNARNKNNRELHRLRIRFETAERDRTIAQLRQSKLILWLIVASVLAALFGVSILFLRRQQRTRIAEAANRARYEEMLLRYRREADALSSDRDLLQALLDSRSEALCLLDADGRVLAVNRAARPLLGSERGPSIGHSLSESLSAEDAAALAAALERMEDASTQTLRFAAGDGRGALLVELSQWEQGDGLVVMSLDAKGSDGIIATDIEEASALSHAPSPQETVVAPTSVSSTDDVDTRAAFRRLLVELMLALIEAWERSTGTNRIEMAERSRIWSINIDDGRLRARAMERYLNLSKLPQNPRWRDVLRTAYYVMGQCPLGPQEREELQRQVDAVLAYTRRNALV
ncbi:MAG: tetratricopeptide repeat protein [Xanthomonadaceae bacterium]|nr:tetratricopeptide repeat protein [Xanthomonadaceae bacterium]